MYMLYLRFSAQKKLNLIEEPLAVFPEYLVLKISFRPPLFRDFLETHDFVRRTTGKTSDRKHVCYPSQKS
jgi:hypothetical protein